MSVEVLPSARLNDAHKNLANLILRAKNDVVAFGGDLPFEAPCWDVTTALGKRVSSSKRRSILYFTTHEGGTAKGMQGRTPMSEPFASFVKAIVRLRFDVRPTTSQLLEVLIRASRYLHDVLADRRFDPSMLVASDFQTAANACRNREAASSQYRVGIFLVEIADWLNRYAISKARIDIRNPFPRVVFDDTRLGKEHDRRRSHKLPAPDALRALGELANLVAAPADIVRMRAIELLACGGWRINELLTLPVDCDIEEDAVENGAPVLDESGIQVRRYGIRYWPEKGAEPRVKWLPTPMIDVAKRAIADLRMHTSEARRVAEWLEEHPGRGLIPEIADLGPEQLIASHPLEKALGISGSGAAAQWARARKVPVAEKVASGEYYRRSEIEAALLADQRFPNRENSPLRLSEHLFLVPNNFFSEHKGTSRCTVSIVSDQQISDFLGGRGAGDGAMRSVFERFNFKMADGSPIELTSHMFRHWLNTLAQQGGMGQHEIARWFGRKEIGQNAAYDHISAMQMAEEVRGLLERGQMQGGIARIHDALPPVERETFRETVLATVHTTDLGMCINDWSLAPCPNHGSCASCGDHLVEKGDSGQRARAELLLGEQEWILERAVAEAEEETYGASNHVAHIRLMRDGLRSIVAVHGNSAIPDGTLVHVNPAMPSRAGTQSLDGGGNA